MNELRFSKGPISILLVAALSLGAVACGDDSDDGDGAGASGSGGGGSGGQPTDIPDFNGCTSGDYVDLSGASADRTITILPAAAYEPKCAIIAAGQSVTISGSFAGHPTLPGNKEDPDAGDYDGTSPIVETNSGMSAEFTFPNAGTYPYYCSVHGFGAGDGMSAVIHVK